MTPTAALAPLSGRQRQVLAGIAALAFAAQCPLTPRA
jgi:hypothetical protein